MPVKRGLGFTVYSSSATKQKTVFTKPENKTKEALLRRSSQRDQKQQHPNTTEVLTSSTYHLKLDYFFGADLKQEERRKVSIYRDRSEIYYEKPLKHRVSSPLC